MTWTKHDVVCSYTSYCTVALDKKKKKHEFFSLFSSANIIQRKFHTIFVSQTFLSERTQVFWLNKILLITCFHGYWACSVSRSAINTLSQEYITLKQSEECRTPRIGSRIIEIKIGGGGLPRNQK